ncbi:uncharacterized protein LOC125106072 isoform X2 [Lutra lutra]|uniref:uncharacterized protein LOC125106072 isoform X2 n=1 Tax=Lutra lutra TaxID=9657 RepID=UPI001FD0AC75|nr:uncharacterized protein LOC125106072 isoform X2 [Lutra lutra]
MGPIDSPLLLQTTSQEKPDNFAHTKLLKMVFGLGCQRERLYKPLYIAHLFILAGVVYYYFQGPVGKTAPDHDMAEEPSQLEGETLRPVWGPMDKCYPVTTQRRRVKSGKKQASEAMTPKAMGGLSSAAPTEETELWSQREGEVRPPEEEAASLGPVAKEVAEEQEAVGTLGWEVRKPGVPTGTSQRGPFCEAPGAGAGECGWGVGGPCWGGRWVPKLPAQGGRSCRGQSSSRSGSTRLPWPPLASPGLPVYVMWLLSRPTTVPHPSSQVSRDVGQETVAYPPEVSEEDSEEERPGGWVPQLLWKLWLDWFPAPDIPKTQNHE